MQLFHRVSIDRPYTSNIESRSFVKKYLVNAQEFSSDADTLRFASDNVTLDGLYLEFGVYKGRTTNYLSALNPSKSIYGFDSFDGLPEDWNRTDQNFPKGDFSLSKDNRPELNPNVKIVEGLFHETLPCFTNQYLRDKRNKIAFIHIDCDLYSSTQAVFHHLGQYISEGTIIAFDDFFNYPGFELHEHKAFTEFLEDYPNLSAKYMAFNGQHEQVVIRIESSLA